MGFRTSSIQSVDSNVVPLVLTLFSRVSISIGTDGKEITVMFGSFGILNHFCLHVGYWLLGGAPRALKREEIDECEPSDALP
jgi:hypothetical protein